eukprot:454559_1
MSNFKVKACNILNYDEQFSTISPYELINNDQLNSESFVASDCDEQLLILLEFESEIQLNSITVHAKQIDNNNISPPKLVHVYSTNHLNIDFNDIKTIKSHCSAVCKANKLKKGQKIKLNTTAQIAAKFRRVRFLVIYIESNINSTEVTYLNGIKFVKNETQSNKHSLILASGIDEENQKLYKTLCQNYCTIDTSVSIDSSYLLQIKEEKHNNEECNLQTCENLKRIAHMLKYYHYTVTEQKDESKNDVNVDINHIYNGYNDVNVALLNDFHHLLSVHVHQFEDIYKNLIKECNGKICSLKYCLLIRRNMRYRLSDEPTDEKALQQMYFADNVSDIVLQQLLDKIHCHYFHSFDTGFKLTRIEKEEIKVKIAECNENYTTLQHDRISESIHTIVGRKVKVCRNISGLERINFDRSTKFRTDINYNELVYDHGIRFFYWKYYDGNSDSYDSALLNGRWENSLYIKAGDQPANDGYVLKDWYIEKKYKNLQEELVNNKIFSIPKSDWDNLVYKAGLHLATDYAKEIRCTGHNRKLIYEIPIGDPLKRQHLITMMAYCNKDMLQAKITETYRRMSSNEPDKSLIARHQNYAIFGRLLREFVECFGARATAVNHYCQQKLFHGINIKAKFATVKACFKGPMSATTDYSAAVNFSQNTGLILEFSLSTRWVYGTQNMKDRNPFIYCWWLSDYVNEMETFFIGGFSHVYISTIIITPQTNYSAYICAIESICESIDAGIRLYGTKISKTILQLAFRLLSHELHYHDKRNPSYYEFKSLPKYVEQLFRNYCANLKCIFFWGAGRQPKIQEILRSMFFYDNGWIKLNLLTNVFSSLNGLWINSGCNTNIKNLELIAREQFFQNFIGFVNIHTNKKLQLQRIIIDLGEDDKCVEIVKKQNVLFGEYLQLSKWNVKLIQRDSKNYYFVLQSHAYLQPENVELCSKII